MLIELLFFNVGTGVERNSRDSILNIAIKYIANCVIIRYINGFYVTVMVS